MTPRIGSACSGYGGLDLAVMAVLGGSVAWHVEYDKHPSAVLDARWPGVPNYGDVTAVDWQAVEPVDVFTAGYPCQPFSHAGKRKGTADERHLWPAIAHAISVLRPGLVVLENVAGHLSLGFDVVLADLAALGYDATWGVVRASDAGAPHGRARLFIAAADTAERGRRRSEGQQRGLGTAERVAAAATDARGRQLQGTAAARHGLLVTSERRHGAAPDADQPRRQGTEPETRRDVPAWGDYEPAIRRWEGIVGRAAPRPTEPGRTGERLSPLFVEWLMGLPAGWVTDILPRSPALKCLGNGVVPQQAALALRLLLPLVSEVAA